ncbi:MAG: hypothetical protein RBT59_04685 [Arcobacteraceae bacterium]|jgi:hypothetical protein|nr:hypothetical protein [Arcobacteraceae bacterium]
MNNKPIFIHSLFRTGSTYLFDLFRKNSHFYCYYEPLNESLINYPREKALKKADDTLYTLMRHPLNEKDYFYEFPFNDNGVGVKLFNQNFSYKDFFLNKDAQNEELYNYIKSLKDYAHARPIFQFCRSSLRTGWFRTNFESFNIYNIRDPHDQWMSYNSIENNHYFNITSLIILCQSNLTIVKDFIDFVGIKRYDSNSLDSEYRYYEFIYNGLSFQMSYAFFYFVWLLALFHNMAECDVILDLESYATSNAEEERITSLFNENNITLDFSDLEYKKYTQYHLTSKEFGDIENQINSIVQGLYEKLNIDFFKKVPFLIIDRYITNKFNIRHKINDELVGLIDYEKIIQIMYIGYNDVYKHMKHLEALTIQESSIELFIEQSNEDSEKISIKLPVVQNTEIQEFVFDISNYGNIINLQLAPLNNSCVVEIEKLAIIKADGTEVDMMPKISANICANHVKSYFFEHHDPQIYFKDLSSQDLKDATSVMAQIKYSHTSKDAVHVCANQIAIVRDFIVQQLNQEIES